MIGIPFIWLPLIICVILTIITFIMNNFSISEPRTDFGFLMMMFSGIVDIVVLAYYIVKGIIWIASHITFV
jgi:hypothetical protein